MKRRKWLTWAVGQEVADKIYDNIERSNTSCYQRDFISGSFYWGGTKEGSKYWSDINSKIQGYLAEKIDSQLASFLKGKGLWTQFIDNFDPPCKQSSYGLGDSFLWTASAEGHAFWGKVSDNYCEYYANCCCNDDKLSSFINSCLTNKSDYENQLQGKEDPRREGNESGRGGIRCEGDEPRFRLSYTQHRKRIDFQKREVGDFKVHLSSRHPVLL